MKILIIGASGLVGTEFIKKINHENEHELILLVRKKIDFDFPVNIKITQIIQPSMTEESIIDSQIKADIYFCSLGSTIKKAGSKENFSYVDYNLVVSFAKLASQNGGALFVISAAGANKDSFLFYNKVKGQMEETVSTLSIKSLYFLRPALLIGNRDEYRPGESFAINTYQILNNFISKKYLKKMATPVVDLVNFTYHEMTELKKGVSIIEEFKNLRI